MFMFGAPKPEALAPSHDSELGCGGALLDGIRERIATTRGAAFGIFADTPYRAGTNKAGNVG